MLADVGDEDGPDYTAAVAKDVGGNTSVLRPQLDTPERQLELLKLFFVWKVLFNRISHSSAIESLNCGGITIPENNIIIQACDLFNTVTEVDLGE